MCSGFEAGGAVAGAADGRRVEESLLASDSDSDSDSDVESG